jgi:hypothetical protein
MKTTILKNIIKEEITKLQEQQQYNSLQYMIVPSNVFGSNQNLMSQHPGFDGLSWAQNFQTTKLTQVTNPCNFLKNQMTKLINKMNDMMQDAYQSDIINPVPGNPMASVQQLRQQNKHYDRVYIKMEMMGIMRAQQGPAGCPP